MNQELQDKINRLKELIPLATQGEWKQDVFSIYVGDKDIINCSDIGDLKYVLAANPQTLLEIIAELESVQLHEHHMQQWAEYGIEEAHKTLEWVHELQVILGLDQCMTKNSRAEITKKVKDLVADQQEAQQKQSAHSHTCCECQIERLDKECDYLARQLALVSADGPLAKVVEHWRNAARNAV